MGVYHFGVEDIIETPAGKIRLAFTGDNHVYCDAEISNGDGGVTINGVLYGASVHLYLNDGKWDVKDYQCLHGTRANWIGSYNASQMTAPARRKFKELCIATVEGYVKGHPTVFREAWEARHANDITAAEKDVAEAEAELKAKITQLEELKNKTFEGQR